MEFRERRVSRQRNMFRTPVSWRQRHPSIFAVLRTIITFSLPVGVLVFVLSLPFLENVSDHALLYNFPSFRCTLSLLKVYNCCADTPCILIDEALLMCKLLVLTVFSFYPWSLISTHINSLYICIIIVVSNVFSFDGRKHLI